MCLRYCGLQEPFEISALIENYCIAWGEDSAAVLSEVANIGKHFEGLFLKYFDSDAESDEEIEKSEQNVDSEVKEIDYSTNSLKNKI